jgi:hypothetical protein
MLSRAANSNNFIFDPPECCLWGESSSTRLCKAKVAPAATAYDNNSTFAMNGTLPDEIDNETVIFAYGSLLDEQTLRTLLVHRRQVNIRTAESIAAAVELRLRSPDDLVILRPVQVEEVRVMLVSNSILDRWASSDSDDGSSAPEALFLYGRRAKPHERGRHLKGGLLIGLTYDEVLDIDRYELEPVLSRCPATALKIGAATYRAEKISFYEGSMPAEARTLDEVAEIKRLLKLSRSGAPNICRWPADVRRSRAA